MAFTKYTNLVDPNAVLTKIRDFAIANGWTAQINMVQDTDILGGATNDGYKLCLQYGDAIFHLRSANGKKIFPTQVSGTTGLCYGIGIIGATGYNASPSSGFWYDQPGKTMHTSGEVVGAGIPVSPSNNLNLYCNVITDPSMMLVFSLEIYAGVFQHIAFGVTEKVGNWTGGALLSASKNSNNMFPTAWTTVGIEANTNHLFGFSLKASTFLRLDVDAAPDRDITWASACGDLNTDITYGYTGKILGIPVVDTTLMSRNDFPKIPHYGYLQSQSSDDSGRNINTLNCISVNQPLELHVLRDPDTLYNFSLVGYVPGIFFISTKCLADTNKYEISYPDSGTYYQVFSHIRRGGSLGYDGLSVKQ
jgi:hypothetical protein